MFSRLYSSSSGFPDTNSFLDHWVPGSSHPLQRKAGALVTFCYPNSSLLAPGSNAAHGHEALKGLLSAENVKHFLERYKHYQSHWPMIHSTFDPIAAYDGLVLTMICIGAVYSERLGVKEVRWLMDVARASVFRSSQVYKFVSQGAAGVLDCSARPSEHIEEIQALVHLHSLFVWHGSQQQRQQGRDDYLVLATVARHFHLFQPFPNGHPDASAFHQPGPINGNEVNTWSWSSWVEQEKRIRVMYLIFLIDASMTMFFNSQPQFELSEIKIPLPADDAAWEAKNEENCARALGLWGEAAQVKNSAGSRRPKQLGMSEAFQFLMQGGDLPQRATNVYSKFILIHAIHIQIFNMQRQMLNVNNVSGFSSSGTDTPQSLYEWTPTDGSISNGSSGYVTPTEGMISQFSHPHQVIRQTMTALDLWKKQWDADMQVQYASNQPRVGFCRDGIHFYFLGKLFLQSSRREDWAAQPDIRCQQVFNLLKQIRTHVASDSASKGLDIGSVTFVDDNYGIADLTLNMKLLFTPISSTP